MFVVTNAVMTALSPVLLRADIYRYLMVTETAVKHCWSWSLVAVVVLVQLLNVRLFFW